MENITLEMLTNINVVVSRHQIIDIGGQLQQVGECEKRSYKNSNYDRNIITQELPEPYLSAVMAVWGDTPTVEDIVEEPV